MAASAVPPRILTCVWPAGATPFTCCGTPMSPSASLQDLLDYTAWQRQSWQAWLQDSGPAALAVSTGPHGDGRLPTIGALIRHIFSAELRYVERILGTPISDTGGVSPNDVAELFELGLRSRTALNTLNQTLPPPAWDVPVEFALLGATVRLTPRKVALHILTHEIRHWAQTGTLLRIEGYKVVPQDLLLSPVQGVPMRQ